MSISAIPPRGTVKWITANGCPCGTTTNPAARSRTKAREPGKSDEARPRSVELPGQRTQEHSLDRHPRPHPNSKRDWESGAVWRGVRSVLAGRAARPRCAASGDGPSRQRVATGSVRGPGLAFGADHRAARRRSERGHPLHPSKRAPGSRRIRWYRAASARIKALVPEVRQPICRQSRADQATSGALAGVLRNGASRTRTGDLLGAIQALWLGRCAWFAAARRTAAGVAPAPDVGALHATDVDEALGPSPGTPCREI